MSIKSQIDRIEGNVSDTYSVLQGKGATMPVNQNSDNLAETAQSIVPSENLDPVLATQDSLISQIQTALQGKGAGSGTGGEDVTAETNQYTSLLTSLESTIDSLPEAGSSGGGGSVETCQLTVSGSRSDLYPTNIAYMTVDDSGNIIYANQTVFTSSVTVTCLRNSIVAVKFRSGFNTGASPEITSNLLFYYSTLAVFKVDNYETLELVNKSGTSGGSG